MPSQEQSFNKSVGQVVQAESVTQQIHHHHDSPLLTQQEKNALKAKVARLDAEFDQPGWETWRVVHAALRTEELKKMRLHHLEGAHSILDLLLERAQLHMQLQTNTQQNTLDQLNEQLRVCKMQVAVLSESASQTQGLLADAEERLKQAQWRLHKQRRGARVGFVLSCVLGAGIAYFAVADAPTPPPAPIACLFEGQLYSVGASVKQVGRCVLPEGGVAHWEPIRTRR